MAQELALNHLKVIEIILHLAFCTLSHNHQAGKQK